MFSLPTLRRGDDRTLLIGVSVSSGTLIGSQSVRCTFKNDPSDDDSAAVLSLSTQDSTITIVDGTHVRLTFGHAATALLTKARYYVDIQVVTSDGLVETFQDLDLVARVQTDVTRTVP